MNKEQKQEVGTEPSDILHVIDLNGYTKQFYGYRRTTTEYTHWISLFTETVQMFGYSNNDDMYKVYDTGMVKVDSRQLQHLIDVWLLNYNE